MLRPHPFADIFPMLDAASSDELRADIAAHGLRDGITLYDGQILDGRNRYKALVEIAKLGLGYKGRTLTEADLEKDIPFAVDLGSGDYFRRFRGTEAEALEFVLSKNLHRRHLNESQRAMVADRLATLRPGRPEADKPANLRDYRQADAAERLHVSERSVQDARVVREHGIEDINAAVQSGDLAVSAAAQLARLPVDEQVRLIQENADPKALSRVAKELRAEKQAAKAEKRIEREQRLGAKQYALPDRKYGVIIADCEWKDEVYSEATGRDRSPDNHYPLSDLETLKSRDVGSLAADDCMFGGWVARRFLKQALELFEHWGFTFVTEIAWIKERPGAARGMGYWFTDEHEVVLICKRGNPPMPIPGTQFPSYFVAPVGEHSAKPDNLHKIFEAYFPNFTKIELNARRKRAGWDVWGNEAEGDDDADESDNGSRLAASGGRRVGLCEADGDQTPPHVARHATQGEGQHPAKEESPVADANSDAGTDKPTIGRKSVHELAVALDDDASLIARLGEAVAATLGIHAELKPGDGRLHTADERLIRRHVIRIAFDDFSISFPRLAAVLGGSKQAAAQLRLAAAGEIEADPDLAAKLAKVPDEVAGRAG